MWVAAGFARRGPSRGPGPFEGPADNRYFWDGSGTPDPEIERLERALEPLRAPAVAPALPLGGAPAALGDPGSAGVGRRAGGGGRVSRWSCGVVAVPGGRNNRWRINRRPCSDAEPPGESTTPFWPLKLLAGHARIGDRPVAAQGRSTWARCWRPRPTGRYSWRCRRWEPSRSRPTPGWSWWGRTIASSGCACARGRWRCRIYAPPGKFYVETPSGTVIDLGCAYSVNVDPSGNGRLAVSAGWVGFRLGSRESLLPAGAECSLRAGKGPGTPRLADASDYFRRAVTVLDGPSSQEDQAFALGTVLSQARPQDAFTLWHLLDRLRPSPARWCFAGWYSWCPPPRPCHASACWRASRRRATGCGTGWGWIPFPTGAAGRPICADEWPDEQEARP